jgi:hypothetical protein
MTHILGAAGFSLAVGVIAVLTGGLVELTRAMLSSRRRSAILQRGFRDNLYALLGPRRAIAEQVQSSPVVH